MSSPLARGNPAETGHAATTLLVAAPVVGLVVSIGLDWLISDSVQGAQGEWPLVAVLIGILAVVLAVVVAVTRLRQGGSAGTPFGGVGRPLRAVVLGGLAAVGLVLALTLKGGGERRAAGSPGIVLALIGLIAALAALVVLFTLLRRRSQ